MKGIRERASLLASFVVLPREPCSDRGLRAKLSEARMQWEELTWRLRDWAGHRIAWLLARPVRRWRRSQGAYDVGTARMPMTVWELQKALREFDPHAPIVIDAPNSNGRPVTLNERQRDPGPQVAVLVPGRIEYEELASLEQTA